MTGKLRLMSAAAALMAVGAGAQLALAQSSQKGAVTAGKAAQTNVARKAPVSHPVDTGALRGSHDLVVALTKDECNGLGGIVGSATTAANCSTGKACYTAGTDGVVKSACITEK